MLKIRLQRVGRKHEPAFRLVLTDSENSTKSGRTKEILGSYDPRKSTDLLKGDRITYWLGQGAKATGSVHNLLVNHKLVDAKKINVLPKKTAPVKVVEPVAEVAAPAPTPVEPAPEVTPEPVEETPVIESAPEPEAAPESTDETPAA